MSEEVVCNDEGSAPVTREYVLNYLVGMGVNAVIGSYNEDHRKLAEEFVSLSLLDISPVGQHLNDKVKIRVLDVHQAELSEWLESRL